MQLLPVSFFAMVLGLGVFQEIVASSTILARVDSASRAVFVLERSSCAPLSLPRLEGPFVSLKAQLEARTLPHNALILINLFNVRIGHTLLPYVQDLE